MPSQITHLKPLFLSEEEALALLNLCLMSQTDADSAKDRAMLKLTDLVRRYIAAEQIVAANPDTNPVTGHPAGLRGESVLISSFLAPSAEDSREEPNAEKASPLRKADSPSGSRARGDREDNLSLVEGKAGRRLYP